MLAEVAACESELAIRMSLGASLTHLLRDALREVGAIVAVALLIGTVGAWTLSRTLSLQVFDSDPLAASLTEKASVIDSRVIVFGAVSAVMMALFVGGAIGGAAYTRARRCLSGVSTRVAGTSRAQRWPVTSQAVAAAVILTLACALVEHLRALDAQSSGLDETVLSARLILPPRYGSPDRQRVFAPDLLRNIRSLGDVERVGLIHLLPLSGSTGVQEFTTARPDGVNAPAVAEQRLVDADYFETVRIPLVAGRRFEARDREESAPVMIVNRAFARRYLGELPLGQRVRVGDVDTGVIGVVADVRTFGVSNDARPEMFRPFWQAPVPVLGLVVRTRSRADLSHAIRAAVAQIDDAVPLTHVVQLGHLARQSIRLQRAGTIMVLLATAIAIVLVGCGLHGLLAHLAAHGRPEFAIRLAIWLEPGTIAG